MDAGHRRAPAATRHLVVPYPPSNSSVRVRGTHWVDRLAAQGLLAADHVVVHGPGSSPSGVAAGEPVLLLRNARRLTRGKYEERLLRTASFGVYDLDDGLPWDDGRLPGLGRWWKRPFPRCLVAERSAAAADRVIAGNATIAEWARTRCRDVVIVPTCVEPSDYSPTDRSRAAGTAPTIGWIGSPATEPYLTAIAPALAEVHRRTGARLEIVSGAGSTSPKLAAFSDRRTWQPDATTWIGRWDVGLMPLVDGVYERAKCGYKLLQYAASAVPAVASPVGVNVELLRKMDGLAATTHSDWVDAVVELIDEPSARSEQRRAAGLRIAQEYSYDNWQAQWLAATGW